MMAKECIDFASDAKNAARIYGKGPVGEVFMQLNAIVSFYLGEYAAAAKYAGILGDVYYASHQSETDWKSGHYNKIAGIAFAKCGNAEQACRHLQQYLDGNCGQNQFEQAEAVNYLLDNNSLKLWNYGLINRFNSLQKETAKNPATKELSEEYSRFLRIMEEISDASESSCTEQTARNNAEKSAIALAEEMFSAQLPKPYTLTSCDVKSVLQELAALRRQLKVSQGKLRSEISNNTRQSELQYQYDRDLKNLNRAITSIDERLIDQMTLNDVCELITCDDCINHHPGVSTLFMKYPNQFSAKIKNFDDLLTLVNSDGQSYGGGGLCAYLVNWTTGDERTRLYTMIYPRLNELKEHPAKPIYDSHVKVIQDLVEQANQLQKQEKKQNTEQNVSSSFFANTRQAATISDEQMAQSAFSKSTL
jgi:hypothetical protein